MMKKFCLKLLIFFAVLFAIMQIPRMLLPTFWGNDIFDSKFAYLDNTENRHDTFFIGTSRINNHINPIFFDKLMGKNSTYSFNLGCPGSVGLEKRMAIKEIINSPHHDTKLVFVELPHFAVPHGRNANTTRGLYFYNLQNWICSLRFEFNEHGTFLNKFYMFKNSLSFLLKNITHYNLFKDEVLRLKNGTSKNRLENQTKKLGFHALLEGTSNKGELKRRQELLNDTTILDKRFKGANRVFNTNPEKLKLKENTFLTQELNNLIEYGEKNSVRVVYLLLPKSAEINYEVAYPTFLNLPEKNRINLADPEKYGDFYKLEYSFDRAHLNKKGANLLTKAIVEEYKEIM